MRLLGYFGAYLGFLVATGRLSPAGARVADLGCGTGAFAEAWAALYGAAHHITLVDPSRAMLDRAAAALRGRQVPAATVQARLEDLPPAPLYDDLLAAHVIEHAEEPLAWLQTLRRLAAPGGRLWLVVSKPHWCNAIVWLEWRHRTYRAEAMADLLEAAGWKLRRTHAFPVGPPSRTSRGYVAVAA